MAGRVRGDERDADRARDPGERSSRSFAPQVVAAITPGFSGERLAQTVELTRIMLLSPILLALGSVATSVLNARGRFAASVMAPIIYNLAIIAGAVFLTGPFGLVGLAVSVVIGSACHLGDPAAAALRRRAVPLHPDVRPG